MVSAAPGSWLVTMGVPEWLLLMAAGAISGAVTKTSTAPLERTKILLQVQGMKKETLSHPKYKNIPHTITTVIREDGPAALWKGNTANVVRIVPAYAIRFATNDLIKERIAAYCGNSVREMSMIQMAVSGMMAGFIQQVLCYPLETVKTRMTLGASELGAGVQYKGVVDCAQQVVRTEGSSALYKGLNASIIYGAPYAAGQMTFYQKYQQWIWPSGKEGTGFPIWVKLLSGACAGVTAQTLVYPMYMMRTRLQSDGVGGKPQIYSGIMDCGRKIWTREGVLGFYRGCLANNVRMVPNGCIQFATFDFAKKLFGLQVI